MQVTISSGNNINGTLILPLFQGEESLPDVVEGIPSSLKIQIERVLQEGDFKAKANAVLTLMGTDGGKACLLYTSPSPRDRTRSRMPSSA